MPDPTHPSRSDSPQEPCAHCDGTGTVDAERNFLLDRMQNGDHTWVGISSDAMVMQVITGAEEPARWPSDVWDLARCEETYKRAPEHLKPAMLKTLLRFRRHIEEGGLYCKGCDNSKGHHYTIRGYCRACANERGIEPPRVTGMRVGT